MSKVTDSIRCVLQKAVSYAEGKVTKSAYHVHVPKAIGTNLDMTQEKSTGRFGFSINTPRHWEQGSRHREGERGARARLSHSTFCFSDFWRAVDSCSSAYHFGSQRQPNAFQGGAARRRRCRSKSLPTARPIQQKFLMAAPARCLWPFDTDHVLTS